MARKKATTRTDASEPLARLPSAVAGVSVPLGVQVMTPTEERRERELEEVLEGLGTDGRVRVWHIIDGRSTYAGELTLDGFSLDVLMDTYGGGDKALAFYQGRQKVESLRVSLDPSIPARNPKQKTQPGQAGGSTPVADMSNLFATMAQSQMASMQMFQGMMALSQQTNAQMMQAVTAMLTAKPERDPLDVATKIAELTNRKETTPASELFSIFEKGMNVAAKLNGGDDDGTLSIAREGLNVLGKIVENNGRQAQATTTTTPQRYISGGQGNGSANVGPVERGSNVGGIADDPSARGVATLETTSGVAMNERPWVAAARPSLPLLTMVIGNVQPSTAAQAIADRLSEDQFSDLLDDIESGTPLEFAQRFQQYFGLAFPNESVTEWMVQTVGELQALVEPDDAPETPAES